MGALTTCGRFRLSLATRPVPGHVWTDSRATAQVNRARHAAILARGRGGRTGAGWFDGGALEIVTGWSTYTVANGGTATTDTSLVWRVAVALADGPEFVLPETRRVEHPGRAVEGE